MVGWISFPLFAAPTTNVWNVSPLLIRSWLQKKVQGKKGRGGSKQRALAHPHLSSEPRKKEREIMAAEEFSDGRRRMSGPWVRAA